MLGGGVGNLRQFYKNTTAKLRNPEYHQMMDYDQVPQQLRSRPEPLIQHRDLNDNYNDNQHIQFQQHQHQQQQHLPPQHQQQQQPVVDHQQQVQQQSWKSWSNGIQQHTAGQKIKKSPGKKTHEIK